MSPIFNAATVSSHLHAHDVYTPSADGTVLADRPDTASRDRAERTQELLLQAAATTDASLIEHLHEKVVLLNIEVAESMVMRYRNRGVPIEDLVQVACLGLVKAARGFDPTKSDNFLSYAAPTILGEVKRFFRDNAWVVKPPRRIQELQAEITTTTARLTHTTGRIPTPRDIARHLNLETKQVTEALAADGCFAPTSLDRQTTAGEEDGTTLADVLGDNDPAYDRTEAMVALAPLCRQLTERDRRLVYLRFYHEWTQAKIAQELGVTQMQVSRLLTRILSQLRQQLGDINTDTHATAPSAAMVV